VSPRSYRPRWATADDWRAAHVAELAELARYREAFGHLMVHKDYRAPSGMKLGRWVASQRAKCKAGDLTPAAVEALGSEPGWEWAMPAGRAADLARQSGSLQRHESLVCFSLSADHLTAIDAMVARGEARSRSEAVRALIARALA
jgi:hypothetical protein